jgi:hypothetical protein
MPWERCCTALSRTRVCLRRCCCAQHPRGLCGAVCKGRAWCGTLSAVQLRIDLQPRHRRLEHGERSVDVSSMLLMVAFACVPFFRSRRLEHRALTPCRPHACSQPACLSSHGTSGCAPLSPSAACHVAFGQWLMPWERCCTALSRTRVWLTRCCCVAVLSTLEACAVRWVKEGRGVLAAVLRGIGVQRRHRRLEHGECYGYVWGMLLAIACAFVTFKCNRPVEHGASAPSLLCAHGSHA